MKLKDKYELPPKRNHIPSCSSYDGMLCNCGADSANAVIDEIGNIEVDEPGGLYMEIRRAVEIVKKRMGHMVYCTSAEAGEALQTLIDEVRDKEKICSCQDVSKFTVIMFCDHCGKKIPFTNHPFHKHVGIIAESSRKEKK